MNGPSSQPGQRSPTHALLSLVFAGISIVSVAAAAASMAWAENVGSGHGLGRSFLSALMLFYAAAPVSLVIGLGYGAAALFGGSGGRLAGLAAFLLNLALAASAVYFLFFHWAQ